MFQISDRESNYTHLRTISTLNEGSEPFGLLQEGEEVLQVQRALSWGLLNAASSSSSAQQSSDFYGCFQCLS